MKKFHILAIFLCFMRTIPAFAGTVQKKHIRLIRPMNSINQVGTASWYGRRHTGQITATGERFNPQAMTCAHRTLPLGSVVNVTDITNGKSVSLRVNDRGPYIKGRIVDLTEGAARKLGDGAKGGLMLVSLKTISIANSPRQRTTDWR